MVKVSEKYSHDIWFDASKERLEQFSNRTRLICNWLLAILLVLVRSNARSANNF